MSRVTTSPASTTVTPSALTPSNGIMTAALAGLMASGVSACTTKTRIVYVTADAGRTTDNDAAQHAADASTPAVDSGAPQTDAGAPKSLDAALDAGPVITKTVKGRQTLASLQAQCDALGGMIEFTAACAGSAQCKGFSYGDWGDDAVLTEHTCAHMNGCNGLSCVVLPPDSGKSGKQVYNADFPAAGPSSCLNCHAVWNETDAGTKIDDSKFKLWLLPGSTRNVSNWLDVSAAEQEGIVAFGKTNALPDGSPIDSMVGYHKLLSRKEVQRVVAYLRTLTPVAQEISGLKSDDATGDQ